MHIYKGILAAGLACCLAGCASPGSSGSVKVATETKYNQLKTGMTYSQVSGVVGIPATQTQRENIAGQVVREAYTWQNSDGSSLVTTFLNGKLLTKQWKGSA